jgi:tetratricopeptide (TPR) repeat protein
MQSPENIGAGHASRSRPLTIVSRGALLFLIVCFVCAAAFSQKLVIEVDTQEGQLLQQIDAEANSTKKLALLEGFAKSFPNHEAITWVLGQMQSSYVAMGRFDKAMETGTRILGLDPDDVAAAHNCLKAAELKKDVELIKRWVEQTSQIVRKVKEREKPNDPDELQEWKQKVDYARQVEQYTEYAIYFAAVQNKDSKTRAKLIETLEQKNPNSEYLAQLRTAQTQVVRQVDIEEAVAAAEIAFSKGEYNVDSLMMVANHLMSKRRDPDKVIAYSARLVDMLNTSPKPAEMSDADWGAKKRQMLGTANWMMGLLYSTQERFAMADRALRQALPNLKNTDMTAGALYHLGYVNFRMAEAGDRIRIHDAVRFTTECIAINSAVQQQAIENLKAMKAEYNLQ